MVIIRVGAWLFAGTIFFVLLKAAGNSFLPLYEGIEIQNPLTRLLILLMERNWTAWLVLLAVGGGASIFGFSPHRERSSR